MTTMYEKQKITALTRENKVSAKSGKPYERLMLKTDKHGTQDISCFGSAETRNWKVGDEIELKVIETISPDGKRTYFNGEYPRKPSFEVRLSLLEGRVDSIVRQMKGEPAPKPKIGGPGSEIEYPAEEINIDDIPF